MEHDKILKLNIKFHLLIKIRFTCNNTRNKINIRVTFSEQNTNNSMKIKEVKSINSYTITSV